MTAFAQVRRTMRADALFQGVLVAGLVGLAASRLTVGAAPAWSHAVNAATDLLMLSLVLAVFLRGLAGLTTLERRFWQLLAAGVGSWLLVTLLGLFDLPPSASWPALALVRSLGYTAIYLWILVALDLRPEDPSADPGEERFRWIDGLGLSFTAFGLFVYLSVIPWALGAAVWGTNVPKVVLYLALDGLLLLRLSAPGPRRAPSPGAPPTGASSRSRSSGRPPTGSRCCGGRAGSPKPPSRPCSTCSGCRPSSGWSWRCACSGGTRRRRGRWRPATDGRALRPAGPSSSARRSCCRYFHTLLVGLDAWEPGHHLASWLWALAVPLVLAGLGAAYLRGVEHLAGERRDGSPR